MSPKRRALLSMLKCCDIAVVAIAFVCAMAISLQRADSTWVEGFAVRVELLNMLFVLAYFGLWHFVLAGFELYSSYRLSAAAREWRSLLMAVVVSVAAMIPLAAVLEFEYVTPTFLSLFGVFAFCGLAVERRMLRSVARRVRVRGRNLREVVVSGDG